VCKDDFPVGARRDCYDVIENITGHYLPDKYENEGDDAIWGLDDIKYMAKCLKDNVRNNNTSNDPVVKQIKQFLEFLIKHRLCIRVW